MKRIFVSVGVVALGANGISVCSAAYPGGGVSGVDSPKHWDASLSIRAFYDDNINTTSGAKQDSFGLEVSPSVRFHLTGPQTDFTAQYMYAAHYTDRKPVANSGHVDQTHSIDLNLLHNFSDRYKLTVSDSFAIGQEPDFLRYGAITTSPQRYSGENIRNHGSIDFSAWVTRLFGFEVGYANSFYDYADHGAQKIIAGPFVTGVDFSRSGLNDRLEHVAHFDTHWQLQRQTVLVVGYQFSETDFTGDEAIQAKSPLFVDPNPANVFSPALYYMSNVRNTRSHYGYVGVNQTFLPNLSGSLRVGATFTESYNDPSHATSVSPYVQADLSYQYLPGCSLQVGFKHDRNANDKVGPSGIGFIHDSETSVAYASVHHRFTPKLEGTLLGSAQTSSFNAPGLAVDGKTEQYYMVGVDVEYHFCPHISAHTGYNFDAVTSELSGDYTRNRVYAGVTINY